MLWLRRTLVGAFACIVAVLALAVPASAHVVPTSTIELAVTDTNIVATVEIPLDDLAAAAGIDLGDETQADVDAAATAIEAYLLKHFTPTSNDGTAWTVTEGDLVVETTGDTATTGTYQALETTFTLSPPAGSDTAEEESSFNLGYDAVVEKVATHVTIVTIESDTTDDDFSGAYEVGTVQRSTVTNTVEELHVDLTSGTSRAAFLDMVRLGMQHIKDGTDHQLFLLTLLLPAPLLAVRRRWGLFVPTSTAVRRIGAITLSFTLGHSLTLALGALGLPAPQRLVEAAIALSILVAAIHAVRPIFPGREALVAGAFGLVHGLAFSETLRALDLSGPHLVLALLGFNVGIEAMQLIVVALVLPPLLLLARTNSYQRLRVVAAAATGTAALGWLAARLGATNPIGNLADELGTLSIPLVVALWLLAIARSIAAPGKRAPRRSSQRASRTRGRLAGNVPDPAAHALGTSHQPGDPYAPKHQHQI
ncbi:HupE/UreJ family protein [Nocardioides zeicaulis]|uniref:HupE/UreJ family protein n=1 Tax=Nocardioides zeicaulis TaxID=1776857 RepID=A0ABV6DX43_9ACTN